MVMKIKWQYIFDCLVFNLLRFESFSVNCIEALWRKLILLFVMCLTWWYIKIPHHLLCRKHMKTFSCYSGSKSGLHCRFEELILVLWICQTKICWLKIQCNGENACTSSKCKRASHEKWHWPTSWLSFHNGYGATVIPQSNNLFFSN